MTAPVGPSSRDAQVLSLLARGTSREEMAAELDCSTATIDRVVALLKNRFGVATTVQAVVAAVRAGEI